MLHHLQFLRIRSKNLKIWVDYFWKYWYYKNKLILSNFGDI